MANYNDKKKKSSSSRPTTKGGVLTAKPTSRPVNYQPGARAAQREAERHVQQRPSVTPSNQVRYSEPGKRFNKEFGPGAKLAAPGTDLRSQQDAFAREKVNEDKARTGYWNVEDVNRPHTVGGVIPNKYDSPMRNSTIDKLTKKK